MSAGPTAPNGTGPAASQSSRVGPQAERSGAARTGPRTVSDVTGGYAATPDFENRRRRTAAAHIIRMIEHFGAMPLDRIDATSGERYRAWMNSRAGSGAGPDEAPAEDLETSS